MNEGTYDNSMTVLAERSLKIGNGLKRIFWVAIAMGIIVIIAIFAFMALAMLLAVKGAKYDYNFKDVSLFEMYGIPGIIVIAVIFCSILVAGIVYCVTLFKLNKYEAAFGITAVLYLVNVIMGVIRYVVPGTGAAIYVLSMIATLAQLFFLLTGIYNSVRRVSQPRANVVKVLRNVFVALFIAVDASELLLKVPNLDVGLIGALLLIFAGIGLLGVSIWYIVELFRSASFLQRFGKSNINPYPNPMNYNSGNNWKY